MKGLLRIAGVLAFLFPFVSGAGMVITALSSTSMDFVLLGAIGSFLVGNAFFVGAMLLFAAEKLGLHDGSK